MWDEPKPEFLTWYNTNIARSGYTQNGATGAGIFEWRLKVDVQPKRNPEQLAQFSGKRFIHIKHWCRWVVCPVPRTTLGMVMLMKFSTRKIIAFFPNGSCHVLVLQSAGCLMDSADWERIDFHHFSHCLLTQVRPTSQALSVWVFFRQVGDPGS